MKQGTSLLLIIVALSACDTSEAPKVQTEAKRNTARTADASTAVTETGEQAPPDMDTWIKLLERTTGTSYVSGRTICTRVAKSKNNDIVVTNISGRRDNFMDLRYTVPEDSESRGAEQLKLLHEAGFLDAEPGTHDGKSAVVYRLTKSGWGRSPIRSSHSQSLCYETGKWRIDKILDYERLDNQGSGLDVYNVTFEIEYRLFEWVNNGVLHAFNQKATLPKQHQTILVKGPEGYYNARAGRNRGLYQNTIMPAADEGTTLARANENFVESLCTIYQLESASPNPPTACPEKDKDIMTQSLIVHNVGIPGGGNMVSFKFSYTAPDGAERFGIGRFKMDEKNDWSVYGGGSVFPK